MHGRKKGDTATSPRTSTALKKGVGYKPTGTATWINPFTGVKYPKTIDTSARPWDPVDARTCETGTGAGGANIDLYFQRYGVSEDEQDQFKGLNPQGFANENYFRNVCTLKGMFLDGKLGDPSEWDGGPTFEEGTDFAFEHSKADPLYATYDCTPSTKDPNPTSDCPPGTDD